VQLFCVEKYEKRIGVLLMGSMKRGATDFSTEKQKLLVHFLSKSKKKIQKLFEGFFLELRRF